MLVCVALVLLNACLESEVNVELDGHHVTERRAREKSLRRYLCKVRQTIREGIV